MKKCFIPAPNKDFIKSAKGVNPYLTQGFTIIELLIVTAIAAIIVSLSLTFMSAAQRKGRDSAREDGIKQLQIAIGLYVNAKGFYPKCDPEIIINGTNDCLSTALLAEAAVKGAAPIDPLNTGSSCGNSNTFRYCYLSVAGLTYTVKYQLETDSILGKSAGWQSVSP